MESGLVEGRARFGSIVHGCLWVLFGSYVVIISMMLLWFGRSDFWFMMPMGVLLPSLLPRLRQRRAFVIRILLITMGAELIQLLTRSETFDLKDMILNFAVAVLAYLLWERPEVQYFLERLELLPSRGKRLFSEVSPLAYKVGVKKNKVQRSIGDVLDRNIYSRARSKENLPVVIYRHKSLVRRTLGQVDHQLQENKAVNLSIATPMVDGILIGSSETFSFWQLVGMCSEKKGYLPGLMIKGGEVNEGIGGGMCQFTNLIHWMVLHSPLTIVEHHHHGGVDMFPDYQRQIPFGTGTSIMHNYKDYRFTNHTAITFQLRVWVDETHLVGELRSSEALPYSYHIVEEEAHFEHDGCNYYRYNEIYRRTVDKRNGKEVEKELVIKNKAKVLYDSGFIPVEMIRG